MMYDRILTAARNAVWAIELSKLETIMDLLERKSAEVQAMGPGFYLDGQVMEHAAARNRAERQTARSGSVAVLPILGVIAQRMDLLTESSGGTSTERLSRDFDALIKDDEVGSIVLEIDSPGGAWPGVPELAEQIYRARGTKPIVAVANSYAASAAYWLGVAADELVVTPSGDVGSVGAYAVHLDFSEQNETLGVKKTYISYGQYKTELNQDAPLADEALAEIQRRVNEYGEIFVKSVAQYRGVTPKAVRDGFGEGRTYGAKEAVARGMADRVGTLRETIARLAGKPKGRGMKASVARRRLELAK